MSEPGRSPFYFRKDVVIPGKTEKYRFFSHGIVSGIFDFCFMNVKRNEKVRRGGLTKKDHIKYWVSTANKDWIAVKKMLECRSYLHALFFMHLVLEKLLKAHWVKNNESNHPPRTKLFEQTKLIIVEKEQSLLREMNRFQLDGRYPDYKQSLYKTYKEKITYSKFASVNIIRKCLLKELQ